MTIYLHKEWVCGLCGKVYVKLTRKQRKPRRCSCETEKPAPSPESPKEGK